MKKITYFFLIYNFLGFAQSLPINFDESTDPAYYFTCFDCNFSLTSDPEDAANKVGQLTSYNYAEFGSAQTIDLDQYVDLSDNNNNTITFRIKPLNGTGSGKHMLKFSGGSTPFGVEVRFTTTGTNWQTITANFGSGFRNYRNLIIFPDFQSFKTDVYLIDDIQGATNIAPRPKPTEDAPIPSIPAERVKGIYGETYTNIEYKYNYCNLNNIPTTLKKQDLIICNTTSKYENDIYHEILNIKNINPQIKTCAILGDCSFHYRDGNKEHFKKIMNLDNLNSLIELFFYQADKQNKKSIFLQWLNPNNKKTYTWEETQKNILKLSKIIRENIKERIIAKEIMFLLQKILQQIELEPLQVDLRLIRELGIKQLLYIY